MAKIKEEVDKCPQCGAQNWISGKRGIICSKCGFTKENDFFKTEGQQGQI